MERAAACLAFPSGYAPGPGSKAAWFNFSMGMPVIACMAMSMMQVDANTPRMPNPDGEQDIFGNYSDECFAPKWTFDEATDTTTDSDVQPIDDLRCYNVTKPDVHLAHKVDKLRHLAK